MYKCNECGTEFETPDTVMDRGGRRIITDWSQVSYVKVCPECGSDDFTEVDKNAE